MHSGSKSEDSEYQRQALDLKCGACLISNSKKYEQPQKNTSFTNQISYITLEKDIAAKMC